MYAREKVSRTNAPIPCVHCNNRQARDPLTEHYAQRNVAYTQRGNVCKLTVCFFGRELVSLYYVTSVVDIAIHKLKV